jgi:hypothetical protein
VVLHGGVSFQVEKMDVTPAGATHSGDRGIFLTKEMTYDLRGCPVTLATHGARNRRR